MILVDFHKCSLMVEVVSHLSIDFAALRESLGSETWEACQSCFSLIPYICMDVKMFLHLLIDVAALLEGLGSEAWQACQA